jgi:hypothetical protein
MARCGKVWCGKVLRLRVEISYGIDHHKDPLRFPYDFTFYRSHDLHPHP